MRHMTSCDHTVSRDVRRLAGDERTLRKMIIERTIAPFYPGQDQPAPDREECPICMLVSKARLLF